MIRKIILCFFVFLFGFFWFSYWYLAPTITIDLPWNFSYWGTDINNITSALNFSSDFWKYLHIIDHWRANNDYYIFWNNNKLYVYWYYWYSNSYNQWYFQSFCKIYWTWYCNWEWSNPFLVTIWDEFYSLTGVNFTQFIGSFQGETDDPWLCFYNKNNNITYCTQTRYSLAQMLSWTLNIPDWTTSFNSYAQYSPFFSTSYLPDYSLDNIYCPTVRQLINNYNRNWFSSWLCYSSNKIYNWSSFVSVEPQSIFDLFSSKEDFILSLNKFATYCESSVYNSDVCASAFSGEDLRFNLISKIPNNSNLWWRKSLYNYCGLYNYDPNTTTCVWSWVLPDYWSDFNYDDIVDIIWEWDYSIVSPFASGSVFDNWFWYDYSWDVITNIQLLFKKFTSLFSKQTSNIEWFLPSWILIPFLLLVLFKLFKK